MEEEWKEYKLGEIFDFNNGLSKGGKFFGHGYDFVSFKTVFKNHFLPNTLDDLVESSKKEREKFSVKEGDVFLTRTSETQNELAYSCVALKNYPNATYNGFTKRLRPNGKIKIDSIFSAYFFRSAIFRNQVTSMSNMVTRASLSNEMLDRMSIKIPSYDLQKTIGKILFSFDAKIQLNKRINDNLEQQAQALFKSWFVDFEPFKDGKFVESELGMIPEGWRVGRFTECVKISSGGTPKTENSEYWNGAIPFFTPKDTSTTVFTYTTEKYVTDLGVTNCNSPIYPTFTVFITARGTVGKIRMAGQPMAMNQSCYALLPYEKGAEPYIYLLTLNLIGAMQKKANGAVFAAITTKDFDEPVIIFSNSILADFMQLITPIFNQIHKIGIENHNLAELRDTLLPKLMSGKLKTNKTTR